jgi:digeranylgeranylglycerophospholipid reductase
MNKTYDIGIVGAGPVGGYIASQLANHVDSLALIEQHKTVGKPVNCAGLVTPRVFDKFSIPKKNIVQNEIKGAHFHSPSGKILTIGDNKIQALSIDRTAFDQYLVSQAEQKKVSIFLSKKVRSIQKQKENIDVICSKDHMFSCSCLIGADGPYSKIRDLFGFPQPIEYLRGIGAVVDDVSLDPDFVEIFIGNSIAPGFFAWMIPINRKGTSARLGLCINQKEPKSPKHYFEKLFECPPVKPFLESANIKEKMGGTIPLGALKQTVGDNVLLVGDAAAQVKPTSGGGIYPGLISAGHCVSTVKKAFDDNNFSKELLKSYHEAWRNDIGKELVLGMQFRKVFKNLTDKHFEKYIEKFNTPSITAAITQYGDIDYPSKLVKPILKKVPSILRLIPQILR